jgi:hypothetical protein
MSKFAEKRKYLFERLSPVNSVKFSEKVSTFFKKFKYKKNWIQNLIKTSNDLKIKTSFNDSNETNAKKLINEKYFKNEHFSQFSVEEKNSIFYYSILNFYQSLGNDHNRENDYLKSYVIPVSIKRWRNPMKKLNSTESPLNKAKFSSFEYFRN